jgi:hypothetical protein
MYHVEVVFKEENFYVYLASTCSLLFLAKNCLWLKKAQCNAVADTKAHVSKPWNTSRDTDNYLRNMATLREDHCFLKWNIFMVMS